MSATHIHHSGSPFTQLPRMRWLGMSMVDEELARSCRSRIKHSAATRIVPAAPEDLAGMSAATGHASDHRHATIGAGWRRIGPRVRWRAGRNWSGRIDGGPDGVGASDHGQKLTAIDQPDGLVGGKGDGVLGELAAGDEHAFAAGQRPSYLPEAPRWPRSKVYDILRDRSYIGEVFYHDHWHPGVQPPIVERMTFERV